MTKAEIEKKKSLARSLFLSGMEQTEIAEMDADVLAFMRHPKEHGAAETLADEGGYGGSAGSWKRSSLISSMWPESCSFSSWYSYSAAQASMNSSERDVAEPLVTI